MSPKTFGAVLFALLSVATARRIQASQDSQSGQHGMREALKGLMAEEYGVSQAEAELVVQKAEDPTFRPQVETELKAIIAEDSEQSSLVETAGKRPLTALATSLLTADAAAAFGAPASIPHVASKLAASNVFMNGGEGSIVVFGGTGGTGSEAIYQALQRGESVVTLARDPSKMLVPEGSGAEEAGKPLTNDALTVLQGSVTNKADVDKVFADKKVKGVVVALGGKTKDVGPTMLQDGTANIIAACKANGVKRISVVTSIGVGDSMDQAPWSFRLLMMTVMKSIMNDKNAQEKVVMTDGADLEYTIVRPGGLKSTPPTGIVTAGKDQEAGAITRGDVAAFCLDAVLESDFKFLKQAVSISSNMGSGFQSVLADKTKSRMAGK